MPPARAAASAWSGEPATALDLRREGQLERQLGEDERRLRAAGVEPLGGAAEHRPALAVEPADVADEAAVVGERRPGQALDVIGLVGEPGRRQQELARALLVGEAQGRAEVDQQVAVLGSALFVVGPRRAAPGPARTSRPRSRGRDRAAPGAPPPRTSAPPGCGRRGSARLPVVGEPAGEPVAARRFERLGDPAVQLSAALRRQLLVEAAGDDRVREGVPAVGGAGDQQAGAFGAPQRVVDRGRRGSQRRDQRRRLELAAEHRGGREVLVGAGAEAARAAGDQRAERVRGAAGEGVGRLSRADRQQQLAGEERVAAALAGDVGGGAGDRLRRADLQRGGELLQRGRAERPQLEAPGVGRRGEGADRLRHLATGLDVGLPVGREQQHRSAGGGAGEMSCEGEGRGLAGMQVVDRQQQGGVPGKEFQHLQGGREEPGTVVAEAPVLPRRRPRLADQRPERGAAHIRQQRRRRLAFEPGERGDERRVGGLGVPFAAAVEDQAAAGVGGVGRFGDQAALARPGLAGHHHRLAVALGHPRPGGFDLAQLLVAAHHRPGALPHAAQRSREGDGGGRVGSRRSLGGRLCLSLLQGAHPSEPY